MAGASLSDTIAAIATPPGPGAIAMVRVSGPAALDILERIAPQADGRSVEARRARLIRIHHPESGELVDQAVVVSYRAPASFTGEDSVEISCHGGILAPQLVLAAAYAAGARPALPGEFTRRAYLNGKLDLIQAEAIGDLVDASSPALQRAALHQLERGLSARLESLRQAILDAEGLAGYSIDFPDEDEPPVPPERVAAATAAVAEQIRALLRTAPQGELLRAGALVVLAGLPNSGKSSLFNALLGTERSIVTEVAGTTRDAVEADVVIAGFPFRLADTAGIRPTDDRVEYLGVEVARRYLHAADIVLFCSDPRTDPDPAEAEFMAAIPAAKTIVAWTKADLLGERPPALAAAPQGIPVSARTGEGLDELRRRLLDLAFSELRLATPDAPIVTRERHARALTSAADELDRFTEVLAEGLPIDVAATHLRAATSAIEELIGAVTTDDVLGTIFSRFCVGK